MSVVPASHTFVAAVATTSEANSFIRDPIAFLLSPPIAELRQIVSQNLTTGVSVAITFTVEDVDTDPTAAGGHSTVTNTSRYTAVYAGWYQVSGCVGFVANNTGRRSCWWSVNGTQLNGSQVSAAATTNTTDCTPASRTKLVYLNVNDYVELFAFQDSGSTLATPAGTAIGASMTVRWMSN